MRFASVFSVHSVVSMAIGMLKWLVETDKSISVVECHTTPESLGVYKTLARPSGTASYLDEHGVQPDGAAGIGVQPDVLDRELGGLRRPNEPVHGHVGVPAPVTDPLDGALLE